jgi:SAM-dependent methyltransferase
MLTILRLNWLMYGKAAAFASIGLVLAGQFGGALRLAILLAVASAAFWTATSLAASWWIYDRSHIFDLQWLDQHPGHWLNLHTGLDEIDGVLTQRYLPSNGDTLDIFDSKEMTEPSIREAHRQTRIFARKANWRCLPSSNQNYDTVFIVFTAHEFRRPEARERLFIEVQRVLRDTGRVVLVEHLRDVNNFAVFGPGAWHFFSRRAWLKSTGPAGLKLLADQRITPFVHAFTFVKRCTL